MAVFLVDGRDRDSETVNVRDAVPVAVKTQSDKTLYQGVTTHLTEHGLSVFLDESEGLALGERVNVTIESSGHKAEAEAIVINITESRKGSYRSHCSATSAYLRTCGRTSHTVSLGQGFDRINTCKYSPPTVKLC